MEVNQLKKELDEAYDENAEVIIETVWGEFTVKNVIKNLQGTFIIKGEQK